MEKSLLDDRPGIFTIYKPGKLTVLGFGDPGTLDRVDVSSCRDELARLIKKHQCESLAFDLTRVQLIPSGLLGLLASLREQGVTVHLYNPCDDIRSVLEITKLDQIMEVHEVNI